MKRENILTSPNRRETLSHFVTGILLVSMLFGPWMSELQSIWSQWSNGTVTNQALIAFLLFRMLVSIIQLSFLYYAVFRPRILHANEQRQSDAFVQEIQAELAELRLQLMTIVPLKD